MTNSIEKHSFLRKVDCEIYYCMVSKYNYSTNLGTNEQGMGTHLSLPSCSYMC